ncbi:MAG: CRISPR-associated endonuclease Cas2 [Rhodothermales bacterium]|nr:CRISPR-associated endonuclease Cas2 [Rhodothermales bacterium]MCA0270329.1 CRISPR-associated endonuclease Cas2 [Bacteroidota bacterium]
MPYVIAVYDVDQKRVAKMLRLFRRYLHWVQNSVFEGDLTESQLAALRTDAEKTMGDGGSVLIYRLRDERYHERIVLGTERGHRSRML